jgi:hypothetical protein
MHETLKFMIHLVSNVDYLRYLPVVDPQEEGSQLTTANARSATRQRSPNAGVVACQIGTFCKTQRRSALGPITASFKLTNEADSALEQTVNPGCVSWSR